MTYDTVKPSEDSPQIVYHHASRDSPEPFTEIGGSAEDATVYLGVLYVGVVSAI